VLHLARLQLSISASIGYIITYFIRQVFSLLVLWVNRPAQTNQHLMAATIDHLKSRRLDTMRASSFKQSGRLADKRHFKVAKWTLELILVSNLSFVFAPIALWPCLRRQPLVLALDSTRNALFGGWWVICFGAGIHSSCLMDRCGTLISEFYLLFIIYYLFLKSEWKC
jgi:hypothetical protein